MRSRVVISAQCMQAAVLSSHDCKGGRANAHSRFMRSRRGAVCAARHAASIFQYIVLATPCNHVINAPALASQRVFKTSDLLPRKLVCSEQGVSFTRAGAAIRWRDSPCIFSH